MNPDNIVMWVTQFSIVGWVCFKTQILLATLRTQNQLRRWILCIIGSRTFVSIIWMCKKQTSVYHSSADSEIISLDAGLRMDGLFALDLWNVVIEVFRSANNTKTPIPPTSANRYETGAFSKKHIQTKIKGKPRRPPIVACGPCLHERTFFSRRVSAEIFRS